MFFKRIHITLPAVLGILATSAVSLAADTPHRALVILASFKDPEFVYTADNFNDMLNKAGYSAEGSVGCASQYLMDQTGLQIVFDVVGPVKLKNNRSYYGSNDAATGNDAKAGEFIADACKAADESENVDFSKYDADGDGVVDNVCVVFAGEDEAQQYNGRNPDYLWSHTGYLDPPFGGEQEGTIRVPFAATAPVSVTPWSRFRPSRMALSPISLSLDGVKINRYTCSAEIFITKITNPGRIDEVHDVKMSPIGTFCHEIFHAMGLVDMYDTDYSKSSGLSAGLWKYTSVMDAGNYNNAGCTPPSLNAIEREMLRILSPTDLKAGDYTLYPLGSGGQQGDVSFRISNPADTLEYYLIECRSNTRGSKWDAFIGGEGLLVYHIDKSERYKTMSELYGQMLSGAQRWGRYNAVNANPVHQCADLIEADGRLDVNPGTSVTDIGGIYFPQTGVTSVGGMAPVKLNFWDGTYAPLALSFMEKQGDGSVKFRVTDILSPIPVKPTAPPADEDPLYIVIQYFTAPENGLVPVGTHLSLSVNNSFGATKVEWFDLSEPITSPEDYIVTAPTELRAEITWGDGTVDYLFKTINVK